MKLPKGDILCVDGGLQPGQYVGVCVEAFYEAAEARIIKHMAAYHGVSFERAMKVAVHNLYLGQPSKDLLRPQ